MKIVRLSNEKLDQDTKLIQLGVRKTNVDFSKDVFFVKKLQEVQQLLKDVGLPPKELLPPMNIIK